ncbi:MAG: MFS transporter [Propionibacteriaceae bacterium]
MSIRGGEPAPGGPGLTTSEARGRWVLAATIAGSSLALLDGTVVNVALARIGIDLGAGFNGLQWVVNGYTLTLAALILLGGVLGDLYGRRRVFEIGTVWFALASAGCAFAPNLEVLVAARALQGIGAALLTPGSLSIISASFAATDRAKAVGYWSGLGGIAAAIGPFLGGWLVDLTWRAVFVINLPVAVAVVLISRRHLPETRRLAGDQRVDVSGTGLVVVMLGAASYGLTRAGAQGWSLVEVGLLTLAVVAGAALVVVERRSRHPLVALDLLADRAFAATNVVTLLMYAALGVLFFLLVLQLQIVAGWSPLRSGVALLPVTALMLLLSGRAGALAGRIGARPMMTVGTLLTGTGFLLLTRIGPDAGFLADVAPATVVLGLGLSTTVAPLTAAVLAAAPSDEVGAASGINNAVARTAGLLAIAVIPGVAGLSRLGTDDVAAFDSGFGTAMVICGGLCGLGAAVAWFGVPAHRDVSQTT